MSEERKRPLINAEKIVFAKHIEQLIIYEGEKPLTAGDMLSACQAQVASALYNVRHKYDAGLYVERAIEQELNAFFDASREATSPNCYLLIAPAGSGKTNLLCHLAQKQVSERPTMLLMGGSLYLSGTAGLLGGIRTELEEASDRVVFRSDGDSLHTLHRLGEEFNRDTLLLIDAINEYDRPAEMRKALQEILRRTRGKRIKLLVTCRDYYWGLFKGDFWEGATVNVLAVDDEESSDTEPDFNLFSVDEHEQALALYLDHYGIIGQPVGEAAEQCRHPLLLRFFCEAYRGQDIGQAEDIRLKELFDRYWEQKLGSIADRMIKQGDERLHDGLAREVGEYLLSIASYMLHNNVRGIPVVDIPKATQRDEKYNDPRSVYGRIRDEFIILEEKELGKGQRKLQIAFVYEEFMEYVMARSLIAEWDLNSLDEAGILAEIEKLTQKFTDFAQILGVVVYLALMLKRGRDLALWTLLLAKGESWQKVVFEAFRKLPQEQIDSSVTDSLEGMFRTNDEGLQEQILDLLKLERFGRASSISPSLVRIICECAKSEHIPIARRAVLALGYIQSDAVIPVLIDVLSRYLDESVWENALASLARKGQKVEGHLIEALQDGGDLLQQNATKALAQLGWEPSDEKTIALYHQKLYLVYSDPQDLQILVQLGDTAIPFLIEALKRKRWGELGIFSHIAEALVQLGDTAVLPLIEALKDKERGRWDMYQVLVQFGDAGVLPLIEALTDSDWNVRLQVARALGQLGDERAVLPLIEALKDKESSVRQEAARALGELKDERAVLPLIEALKDKESSVRSSAARALGELNDERAVLPLIEALKDKESSVRSSAAEALRGLSDVRAVLPLIEALKDGSQAVRYSATASLGQLGDERAVQPLIIRARKTRSWLERVCVVEALAELGDERAVLPLIEALKDKESRVRNSATAALAKLSDERAVLPLIEALKDEESSVRSNAAAALAELGDERAVPPLIEALGDYDTDVESSAAAALAKLGDGRAVLPLIDALYQAFYERESSGGDLRCSLANALEQLGDALILYLTEDSSGQLPDEETVIELGLLGVLPLIKALAFSDREIREKAAITLGQLGDERAVLPLIEALKDEESSVRQEAARALAGLGDAAVLHLIEALTDSDWNVRAGAAAALAELGDERAVLPLIEALKDKESSVRQEAARAMAKLSDERTVLPLIEALKDKESSVRGSVAIALGQLGDVRAVLPLIEALKDKESSVRAAATEALGKLSDERAVLPLIEALKDKESSVRGSVAIALGQLGDERAVLPLIETLKDRSGFVREGAARAIRGIRSLNALTTVKLNKTQH